MNVYPDPILIVENVSKTYKSGLQALKQINLQIRRGEIFALLGPNGAGKTTLISIICGIVNLSAGRVIAAGFDTRRAFRQARTLIGLVPQELATDAFESVWDTVNFSRGLFGKRRDPAMIEGLLRQLSLWEKRNAQIMTLSGGMKRRVMIAKALSHEPAILFLDEPTAGVDVELRREMWAMVRELRAAGTTIILTTHYIEEAEEMADRIGVINHGELILVEEKATLMRQLGRRQLILHLQNALAELPVALAGFGLELQGEGQELVFNYDANRRESGIAELLAVLQNQGVAIRDMQTRESSLEDIFVDLVRKGR